VTRSPTFPRIYFSLRSPFSWISLHAIEATRPEVLQTSELLPYWDPAPRNPGTWLQARAAIAAPRLPRYAYEFAVQVVNLTRFQAGTIVRLGPRGHLKREGRPVPDYS
jgi:hypothetical protein